MGNCKDNGCAHSQEASGANKDSPKRWVALRFTHPCILKEHGINRRSCLLGCAAPSPTNEVSYKRGRPVFGRGFIENETSAKTSPGKRCGLPSELPRAQPVGQVGAWRPVCGDTPLKFPISGAAPFLDGVLSRTKLMAACPQVRRPGRLLAGVRGPFRFEVSYKRGGRVNPPGPPLQKRGVIEPGPSMRVITSGESRVNPLQAGPPPPGMWFERDETWSFVRERRERKFPRPPFAKKQLYS